MWAFALPALACLAACAPATRAGEGIVSTSLCGDGYARASGGELAALSWQSDGPLGSGWTGLKASADAEALVAMQPDVLLLGPGERVREALLPGTDVIRLDWTESLEGVGANLARLPGAVSEPRAPDADPVRPATGGPEKTVLYLSRSGGTAGPGTYVDAAIRLAGGRNLVTTPGWFTPDPEWIVAQDPDVVLLSFLDAYESVNATLVRNRAVAEFVATRPTIEVPGRLWPCAGPGLDEAVQIIRDGLG